MESESLETRIPVAKPTLEDLLARDHIAAAWKRVRSNHGAPGPDGMTVEQVEKEFEPLWQPVAEAIRAGTYAPAGFREIRVPKPSGGERLLRIPSVIDRVVLQATARVLEPVWEPVFSSRSFGYRKGRGPVDGVLAAATELDQGNTWAADLDIRSFFDRVDLALLAGEIRDALEDGPLLAHVLRCVDAGGMVGTAGGSPTGVPQGSPLSPLLANIALHKFDCFAKGRGLSFVRYADDIVVFCASQQEAADSMERIAGFLKEELHLELHPEKSKVVGAPEVRFLGFAFRRMLDGKFRPCLSPEARDAFRARVIELTEFRPGVSFEQAARETGSFFRQWVSYFAYGGAHALIPRDSLCGFARVRLRGLQWLEWGTDERRLKELIARGVPEEKARQDLRRKLPTAEAARCAAISTALPNKSFAPYGLAEQVIQHRPSEPGKISPSPKSQTAPACGKSRQHPMPAPAPVSSPFISTQTTGSTVEIILQPNGWMTLRIHTPGQVEHPK